LGNLRGITSFHSPLIKCDLSNQSDKSLSIIYIKLRVEECIQTIWIEIV
jgi:hypothetical protein